MQLTIALERYDRHFPFFDGTVKPPKGIELKPSRSASRAPARDGLDRHGRMLKGEFDVAEFSMSTYLMAIDRKLPITGVPMFPRRLFSAGLFFVRADSPLHYARRPQGQARRDPLVPDHAVAARQGRSQVRIRRAVGGYPLAARGRGEDRVHAEAGLEDRDAAGGHRRRPSAARRQGRRRDPAASAELDHARRGAGAPAVRRCRRRGAALLQEIRLLADHAHHGDP